MPGAKTGLIFHYSHWLDQEMTDAPKKSSWESLLSALGVSPTAETPPPPPPAPAAPVVPAEGTPSQGSMRPAAKGNWQDLAQTFGIRVPEAQSMARRPADPAPPVPETSFAQPLSLPDAPPVPASDAPVMLSPLAADTYKFEVIEETEIEFSAYQESATESAVPFEPRSEFRGEGRSDEPGDGRRRRRRRRRGGRRERHAEREEGRHTDEGGMPDRFDEDEPQQPDTSGVAGSPGRRADLDEDELDAIEAAARREDLGLPPLDHRRPDQGRGRGRRRRRGGRQGDRDRGQSHGRGREESAREPIPDGVAHGDEYDILDDVIDQPDAAERPYGGHELEADGGGAHDETHDQDGGDGEGNAESLHRNIQTWEQAVGTIIAKNMESRARFPGTSQPRGRGRGRHRGRGRGRGGPREG